MATRPQVPVRALRPFSQIRFGFASAEDEAAADPSLLVQGFLDLHGADTTAVPGNDFLILGYKGSGKSAFSEHLRLRSLSDPLLFVRTTNLSDFDFHAFTELADAVGDRNSGYVLAWVWLLTLQAIDSISRDERAMTDVTLA